MEQTSFNKTEKKVIASLRANSNEAIISKAFRAQLKRELLSTPSLQPQNSFPLIPVLTAGAMGLIALMFIGVLMVLPEQEAGLLTKQADDLATFESAMVADSNFVGVAADFETVINSARFDLLADQLDEEVRIELYGTDCCGEMQSSEALDELAYQLREGIIYDFDQSRLENFELSQIARFEDFVFGIDEDRNVIGYMYNPETGKVASVVFAKLIELLPEFKFTSQMTSTETMTGKQLVQDNEVEYSIQLEIPENWLFERIESDAFCNGYTVAHPKYQAQLEIIIPCTYSETDTEVTGVYSEITESNTTLVRVATDDGYIYWQYKAENSEGGRTTEEIILEPEEISLEISLNLDVPYSVRQQLINAFEEVIINLLQDTD